MKTQLSNLVLGLAFLSPALSFAQDVKIQPCNTYAGMEAYFNANPGTRASYEAKQDEIRTNFEAISQNRGNTAARTTAAQYTIPVVFHILHQGGPENVSDQVIINALDQVNKDYSRGGSDVNSIMPAFQALYEDCNIKMMLAHKDPDGKCTSGIIRHYDAKTNWSQGQAGLSASYYPYNWDENKYLNIYIVASIIPTGTVTGGGIIVGYTYKPGTFQTLDNRDAIIYRYDFLSGLEARSLSHEMGHWYGLDHTFGGNNNPGPTCGDDGLADTPATKGNFGACPAAFTNSNVLCNTNNANPYYQNYENIMDYSSCPKNFTHDQAIYMQSSLISSISGRNNLWSSANLIATDVNGVSPCAPVADFLSTSGNYTVCSGGSLNLKDYSYNGTITTYQWAGSNGAIAASPNNSLTSMVFPNMGNVTVTLTVGNAQGTSNKVRNVTVLDGSAPGGLPQVESFENAGVPAHWMVSNTGGSTTWERTEDASYDGFASFYIDGSTLNASSQNYLQMPIMNMQASTDKDITFSYAYAKKNASQADQLKIQGSKDCGGTWNDIISINSNVMSANSGGVDAAPFFPLLEQWKTFTITNQTYPQWTPYINLPSVMLRYTFVSGNAGGNNIFIDAVKTITTSANGVNELTKSIALSLYPNPSNGEATISFKSDDAASVKINVVDIYGKVVLSVMDARVEPGQQTISINKDKKLANGIYFIDMNYNGTRLARKLIIE